MLTECVDQSDYCSIVPMMKLCRFTNFKTKCCHSCRTMDADPPSWRYQHPQTTPTWPLHPHVTFGVSTHQRSQSQVTSVQSQLSLDRWLMTNGNPQTFFNVIHNLHTGESDTRFCLATQFSSVGLIWSRTTIQQDTQSSFPDSASRVGYRRSWPGINTSSVRLFCLDSLFYDTDPD